MRKTFMAAAVGGTVLAASLLAAPMAMADDHGKGHGYGRDNLRTRGACTVSSEYKADLQNKRDGQRVKFQVDTAVAGEAWQLDITADSVALAPLVGTAILEDEGDSDEANVAEVEWKQTLSTPATELAFLATNLTTNETCSAKLTAGTVTTPLPPKPPVSDPVTDPVTEPAPAVNTATTSTQTGAAAKKISRSVVATHNSVADCWSVIGKNVYNLTSYVSQHPGGSAAIAGICGANGTAAFKSQHMGSGKVATVLAAYKIGKVKK